MDGIYISPSLGPIPQNLRTPKMRKTDTGMGVSQTQNTELMILPRELRSVFEIHRINVFHDQVGRKQEHIHYY